MRPLGEARREESGDEVRTAYAAEASLDAGLLLWLVPEEELPLCQLLLLRLGATHWFERVWVEAGIPGVGSERHRRRCEVLHLFELEVQLLRGDGQFCHVGLSAPWMAGDEVRYDLLLQVFFPADGVEDTLEVIELLERRFPHQHEHLVGGVLRSNLQPTAYMACDEFPGIFFSGPVGFLVIRMVEQEVVSYPAANETLLHSRQRIYSVVEVKQFPMVGVKVRTNLGMYAAGPLTFLADAEVSAVHTVHVCRRAAEVREVTFEVGHLCYLSHLFYDALFRTACDEFPLVC